MNETKWCFKLEIYNEMELKFPISQEVYLLDGYTKEVFENWLNTFDVLYKEIETNCVYPIDNIQNEYIDEISGGSYLISDKLLGNEFYCHISSVWEVKTDTIINEIYSKQDPLQMLKIASEELAYYETLVPSELAPPKIQN